MKENEELKAVRSAILISAALFLISLIAGIISDSIALLLDASAGFVILFAAFMVRASIKKINMPPDHLFNFGYEKFEPFTVMIQGVMLISSCVIASGFAIQDIIHAEEVARYDIPVIASLLSGIISMVTVFYLRRVSLRTRSAMLKISSLHWFVDGSLSFAMCLGFGFGWYMNKLGYNNITPYVDPVMALVLALIFMWTPIKAIRGSFLELLDAAPVDNIRKDIEMIVEKHKARAFGIHNVRMRKAGRKVFLEAGFIIHGDTTTKQAQAFAESVEKDMAAKFPKYDITVYFHPAA